MRSQTDDSAKAGFTSVLATREVIRVSPNPVYVRVVATSGTAIVIGDSETRIVMDSGLIVSGGGSPFGRR